ncbi:hypothetical protein MLD38_032455 [Melastoma candidum]|uniref:Uncharacterized protein n=1 Tax=Melastoma candidum TaxID=119954 RepID=A0ACB9M430_9MYRT|nr:hypothetical protein MLD38_032455 [Melastoma candidum]
MDRGEPALVPQWLKNNGSTSNGGGVGQPNSFSSSSRPSDDHLLVKHARTSANTGVKASERTTAGFFHRNSGSRGSAHLQSYGSFGSRSNRNGVYEDPVKLKEKEKLIVGVNRSTNHSDYLGNGLQHKFGKDELQRSKSVNGRRDEGAPRRNNSSELCDGTSKYHSSGIVLPGSGNAFAKLNKPSFEYDFPSLVSEDNLVAPEIGRVRSPGFQRQLSPTSDGWTSVLAEAPGTNGTSRSSILPSSQIPSNISSPLPRSMVPPNMAEAVAQIPVRARTPPELSANTQRLEELAIKKSKQLIPMTPNTPRSHITSSLDKSRTRIVQPQIKPSPAPSISGSQPLRVGTAKLDAVRSSNLGKLQILSKDLNGVYSSGKERLSTPNGFSVSTSSLGEAPPTDVSPAVNSLSHQRLAGLERKPAVVSTNLEKKPSLQAQSRIEFFNCLKQKSSSSGNSAACNGDHSLSSTLTERSDSLSTIPITLEMKEEAPSNDPASDRGIENGMVATSTCDGDDCILTRHPTVNGEQQLFPLNEEDAAFMRSLGWEESTGEDEEGLTEEEINSFFQERANMGLSSQSLSVQEMALQLKAGLNNCLGFSGARSWSMPRSES